MSLDKDDLNDIKKLLADAKTQLRALDDRLSLEDFHVKKAADYFNEKAAKDPATAERSLGLAKIFADAAAVNDALNKSGKMPALEETRVLQRMDAAAQSLGAERATIAAYAAQHIDEFIAADPDRWARMEKNLPHLTAKLKTTGKPNP